MPEETPKKRRNPLWLLLKLVIVVVILAVTWKFGFGPLLSARQGRPSVLYVVNSSDQAYNASFGWRGLKRVLHPHAYVQYQLFVGMKEKQTLKLTPEGGGATRKIPVELYPDCLLLLNLDKGTTYYTYKPEAVQQASVGALPALRGQLVAHQNPTALLQLVGDLKRIGGDACTGSVNDLFIDLHLYSPWVIEMDAYNEYPEPASRPHPLLTTETVDLSFANGQMRYNGASPDRFDATVKLDAPIAVTFRPGIQATVKEGATLSIHTSPDSSSVSLFSGVNDKVTWENTAWEGSWSYRAEVKNGRWQWAWSFGGAARIKGDEYSLSLVLDHNRKVKAAKEKMEMEPMP